MNPSTSPCSKKTIVNPYKKMSKEGEYKHDATSNPKKGKSFPDYVGSKSEYVSTPSPRSQIVCPIMLLLLQIHQ